MSRKKKEEVRKDPPRPNHCGLCGQSVYLYLHPILGWVCNFDGTILDP